MIENPKVLISVLNWNNAGDTIRCIDSLKLLSYKAFEIVIVDNASIDNSVNEIKSSYPDIRLIQSKKNLGYAGGNKLASDLALKEGFDMLWVLNNDSIVYADTLSKVIECWKSNGDALYGSVVLDETRSSLQFGGGYELDDLEIHYEQRKYNAYNGMDYRQYRDIFNNQYCREVADLHGASVFIPMEIIRKYGFMKTDFFLFDEEIDYCFSLRKKAGIKSLLVLDSCIYHVSSASFNKSSGLVGVSKYYNIRNYARFRAEHFGISVSNSINKYGGKKCFFSFFIKYWTSKSFRKAHNIEYFERLGVLHALLNIKGKVFAPEKYL